jgi:hypothetical protein
MSSKINNRIDVESYLFVERDFIFFVPERSNDKLDDDKEDEVRFFSSLSREGLDCEVGVLGGNASNVPPPGLETTKLVSFGGGGGSEDSSFMASSSFP